MKKEKVWLITGASRGLGLEITRAVLEAGDQVIAAVRSRPEDLARELNEPANLLVVTLDTTDTGQIAAAVARGLEHFGRIDVLLNNAGFGLLSAVEEASDAEVRKNFETNYFGVLNMIRAVLPGMRAQRSGHIINMSSVAGLSGSAGWGIYASTKFAVEGMTEALSKELAPLGIFATAIEPGYFRTNFLDQSSLAGPANSIADYEQTVGAMRVRALDVNRAQPGDPRKLALALVQVAQAEKPPLHLPMGRDSLNAYLKKTAEFQTDIDNWQETIVRTELEI